MWTYALIWLIAVSAPTPTPGHGRPLDCAAVRAELAHGRSTPEVAVQFHSSTRRVRECERAQGHQLHESHGRSFPTRTPIPMRTDFPTPYPSPGPAGRRPRS